MMFSRLTEYGFVTNGRTDRPIASTALADMNINFQKSCCLRVGPRCDVTCAVISSLPWVTEMRYLGVFFLQIQGP